MAQKPELRRVPFHNPEDVIKVVEEDGCCIATGFTSLENLQKVNSDVEPYLSRSKSQAVEVESDIFPPQTRFTTRLYGRSLTAREIWLRHPTLHACLNHFLEVSRTMYHGAGGETVTFTSKPMLSLGSVLDPGPGAGMQPLHRDDDLYYHGHGDVTKEGAKRGDEVCMAFLVPAVSTTYENGATLCIPGSHLWGDARPPHHHETVPAVMHPGEALALLGSTFHAGGANATADQRRPVHSFFFVRGMMRQEENPYLAYTPEEVVRWSGPAQELAGFGTSYPNVGHVGFRQPIDVVREIVRVKGGKEGKEGGVKAEGRVNGEVHGMSM